MIPKNSQNFVYCPPSANISTYRLFDNRSIIFSRFSDFFLPGWEGRRCELVLIQKRAFLDERGQPSANSCQQNLRKTRDWLKAES